MFHMMNIVQNALQYLQNVLIVNNYIKWKKESMMQLSSWTHLFPEKF